MLDKELNFGWDAFQNLPQTTDVSDFHCATFWTRLDMDWRGVRAQDLLIMASPLDITKHVTLHDYDGYTPNLPLEALLEALLDDDVIVAHLSWATRSPQHTAAMRAWLCTNVMPGKAQNGSRLSSCINLIDLGFGKCSVVIIRQTLFRSNDFRIMSKACWI